MANTNSTVKITKAQVLEAVKVLINDGNQDIVITVGEADVTAADVINYCDVTLEQLAKKSVKSKENNEKKKAEGDALGVAILEALTEEPQDADQLIAKIGIEELTKNKIASRLSAPVKEGIVIKEVEKVDKKQRTTYRLPSAE